MKKAISIIRFAALAVMGCVGTILLFGEEQDEDILAFFLHFLFDKAFGLAMLAATCVLFWHWCKADHWLKAIDEWCEE